MAKIFLDTNHFIDLFSQRKKGAIKSLHHHQVHISPLSCHILVYVYKLKIPNPSLTKALHQFSLIPLSSQILQRALQGPTAYLEDNLQLHSATQADCTHFLTSDKTLLKLGFFGNTQISSSPT